MIDILAHVFEEMAITTPPPLTVAEITDEPDQAAAWLAAERPGPDGVAALSMLDPERLSHAGRVDALVAIERQMAWLAAAQQRVLATMATRDVARADDQWVREDVACALRLATITAQSRLHTATELARRLPGTLRLLDGGAITYLHARALVDAVTALDDDVATAVETRVLPRAGEQTLANFKRSLTRAVQALDPLRTEEHHQQGLAERRVCLMPREDGTAELWALLPANGAAAVMAAVDALASVTSATDPRTSDQRRADALVDIAVAALHDPLLPKAQGMRPAVQVTVAATTLLGLDEQPGELAGHGPIPASLARHVAADQTGTWRRLITDPVTGALLDYGRRTYRPPRYLADHVIARDRTCGFPTCNRAAHRCDLDHREPYDAGGSTSAENLIALCRRHHTAKHRAGWQVSRADDGSYHWMAPTGHRYTSTPPPYPTGQITTAPPDG